MVSSPAVASSLTGQSARLCNTNVSGPGQKPAPAVRVVVEMRERVRRGEIGQMRDQRIEGGPSLGGIKPRHRLAIGRVGAEAIDRLGREGDEPAGREAARGVRDGVRIGLQNARCELQRS